jgi:hypothetical protein
MSAKRLRKDHFSFFFNVWCWTDIIKRHGFEKRTKRERLNKICSLALSLSPCKLPWTCFLLSSEERLTLLKFSFFFFFFPNLSRSSLLKSGQRSSGRPSRQLLPRPTMGVAPSAPSLRHVGLGMSPNKSEKILTRRAIWNLSSISIPFRKPNPSTLQEKTEKNLRNQLDRLWWIASIYNSQRYFNKNIASYIC